MKKSKVKYYCLVYSASFIFLVVFVGPFLWLVSLSFQLERQIFQVPPVWFPDPINFESYKEIFLGAFYDEAFISTFGKSSLHHLIKGFILSALISLL